MMKYEILQIQKEVQKLSQETNAVKQAKAEDEESNIQKTNMNITNQKSAFS